MQQQSEDLAKEGREDTTLSEIQKILYSTEVRLPSSLSLGSLNVRTPHQDGFEVPEAGAAGADEEETF